MPKRLTGSFLFTLFLAWMAVAAATEELIGQVVGVTDGDTLTLLVAAAMHRKADRDRTG